MAERLTENFYSDGFGGGGSGSGAAGASGAAVAAAAAGPFCVSKLIIFDKEIFTIE